MGDKGGMVTVLPVVEQTVRSSLWAYCLYVMSLTIANIPSGTQSGCTSQVQETLDAK